MRDVPTSASENGEFVLSTQERLALGRYGRGSANVCGTVLPLD